MSFYVYVKLSIIFRRSKEKVNTDGDVMFLGGWVKGGDSEYTESTEWQVWLI